MLAEDLRRYFILGSLLQMPVIWFNVRMVELVLFLVVTSVVNAQMVTGVPYVSNQVCLYYYNMINSAPHNY